MTTIIQLRLHRKDGVQEFRTFTLPEVDWWELELSTDVERVALATSATIEVATATKIGGEVLTRAGLMVAQASLGLFEFVVDWGVGSVVLSLRNWPKPVAELACSCEDHEALVPAPTEPEEYDDGWAHVEGDEP